MRNETTNHVFDVVDTKVVPTKKFNKIFQEKRVHYEKTEYKIFNNILKGINDI